MNIRCKKQYKNDGSNERDQDDINPIEIKNHNVIKEGDEFCLYICNPEIYWNHLPDKHILGLHGLQVTQNFDDTPTLATTNKILTNGVHYLEVQIIINTEYGLYLGVCKLDLDPNEEYSCDDDANTWLMYTGAPPPDRQGCTLFGNESFKELNNIEPFKQGDKVGILLNLDNGSLTFIKNRTYGFGFPNGSVVGPVTFAVHMYAEYTSIKIIENAKIPENISIEFIEPAVDNSDQNDDE